jgi:preprotein translocase subunit YajC
MHFQSLPSLTLVIAQDTPAPSVANPNMVGLPDGAQPAPTTGQAQTGTPAAAPAGGAAAPGGMWSLMLPMLVVFGVLIIMQVFTGKKEAKRRKEMLESMKRGDQIQTSGGVIGTVAEIHDDDVVIRLEEGRMRITRAAVAGVIKSSKGGGDSKPEVVVKAGKEKAQV